MIEHVTEWAQAVIAASARRYIGDLEGWAIDVEFAFITLLEHARDQLSRLCDEERQHALDELYDALVTEARLADCPVKMQPKDTTNEP